MKYIKFAVLMVLVFASVCLATEKGRKKMSMKPSRFVTYKTVGDMELKLHIFDPSGEATKPRSAIVFFFGGGWKGGTPRQFYYQCKYLASRGMVAISAEYRTKTNGGVEPRECVKDGKAAIRYVRKHAKEIGIDPNRIAAGGGSAGGHIAAATGTVKGFEHDDEDMSVSSRPDAMVLFNPVYDNSQEGYGFDRVEKYWEAFSPRHNIDKKTPPTIVFLGSRDKHIKVSIAEAFRDEMQKLGIKSELFIYQGQEHGFFNFGRNRNKWFLETLNETHRFLAELGYVSGEPAAEKYFKERKKRG
ncbi:MAG: alpha/beta hydrolase fold domain-containing protein [Planctomycetota bacterium]